MDAILLISRYPAIFEKWQPLLAPSYTITLASESLTPALSDYALIILDSQFIDNQWFSTSQIKTISAKVLIIGDHWSEDQQVSALAAGAKGYCDASVSASIILKAIESILQNEIWIQRHLIHRVLNALSNNAPPQPAPQAIPLTNAKIACLSKREQDVAQLICQGISNKRIASTLFISERTVKAHLTSIFTKLNVSTRLHLGLLLKATEEQT